MNGSNFLYKKCNEYYIMFKLKIYLSKFFYNCRLYVMVLNLDSGKTWTPLFSWTGPDAALYRGFDNMIGWTYMVGSQQRNHAPLIVER